MSDEITELPHAQFKAVAVNEWAMDQRQSPDIPGQPSLDDPIGLRFGAWANPLGRSKWYIAKISLDVLRWIQNSVHRTEVGFIKLAIDELFDGDGQPVPQVSLYLTPNTTGSSDSDMQPVVTFSRRGTRFFGSVFGLPSGGGTGHVTRFYTDGGKFMINWQDDTNLPVGVVYATHGSTDESQFTAVGTVAINYF